MDGTGRIVVIPEVLSRLTTFATQGFAVAVGCQIPQGLIVSV